MVVCPHCRHESSGRFFCDRCHTLLPLADSTVLPAQVSLADGRTLDCAGFGGTFPADCWRPVEVTCCESACRVYALNSSWWRDLSAVIGRRSRNALEVLAPLEVVPVADGAVVVAHGFPGSTRPLVADPCSGVDLGDDPLAQLSDAVDCCKHLARALTPLHAAGLVWLNFDPRELLLADDRVQIAGLDLRVFPAGAYPDSLGLSPAYSPPEVCGFRGDRVGPATDVFHVSAYLWYRLAGLLPCCLPGGGLEAADFAFPPLRIYNKRLPPGIVPVLARGLAREPTERFASVADLAAAFSNAAACAERRAGSSSRVRVDVGAATAIGKSHVIQGLCNQDAHFVNLPSADTLVGIVADGVTHARIGSGDQASRITIEVLSGALLKLLPGGAHLDDEIQTACLTAAQAILDAALADLPAGRSLDPVDVMSSTVVLAILRDNELTLASAGDSRAYLLHGGVAEQLTVDDDVRCTQLAAGMPPEEARELGADGQALYCCLGVGELAPDGRLVPSLERSRPRLSHWKLVPGDVLLLCTDGLVEEGVFLEPGELPPLVNGARQSAAAIAEVLVSAATSRHREASPWEPEGRGDDVTCVVVVVNGADEA